VASPRNRSRFPTRSLILAGALARWPSRRRPSGDPARILVAQHPKMIGDALMIAPLLAKLRNTWPSSRIVFTASRASAPLFEHRPWGIEALAFDDRDTSSLGPFRDAGPYDLAIVPGDNRLALFARAVGARWIMGFSGDRPAYKDRFLDQRQAYPDTPGTWGDLAADLVPGNDAPAFEAAQWPAPACSDFEKPARPYALIHLGASTPLKLWPAERWRAVAGHLEERGLEVAWSAGPGEERLVAEVDPEGRRRSYAGKLDLAQLWTLLAGARLLVSPDTGVAHLARATATPTVSLFGPGTHVVCGLGKFWRQMPWTPVVVDPFECRDQRILFKRDVQWVRRCSRTLRDCSAPRCMHAIEVARVLEAVDAHLAAAR
jgi:ADP-heptose:LPS heptosyltransferase